MGTAPAATQFIDDALSNDFNRAILDRLPDLQLPDAWLVAGCLFQTVWNRRSGRAPASGIKDYDVFYFDANDLSAQAETLVAQRVKSCFRDLGITIETKNQARVHTWYTGWFGFPYQALADSRGGIDRFLVPCTSVGLQTSGRDQAPQLYAPHGLDDLYAGILRPNPLCDHRPLFLAKAHSYRARWDWLTIAQA